MKSRTYRKLGIKIVAFVKFADSQQLWHGWIPAWQQRGPQGASLILKYLGFNMTVVAFATIKQTVCNPSRIPSRRASTNQPWPKPQSHLLSVSQPASWQSLRSRPGDWPDSDNRVWWTECRAGKTDRNRSRTLIRSMFRVFVACGTNPGFYFVNVLWIRRSGSGFDDMENIKVDLNII